METVEKTRLTDAQIQWLEAGELVVMPASWEAFEEFLAETDYRVEYNSGRMIIMGLAKFIHEALVIRLGYLLTGFYLGKPFYVAGSNAGIRKNGKRKHHNGDVLVVKGKPIYQESSRSIITNPYLVVEILSESTTNYDLGEKRRQYEKMETMQELVFVDPFNQELLVCRRTERPNVWLETTYSQPDDTVVIDGHSLRLDAVFANLPEE